MKLLRRTLGWLELALIMIVGVPFVFGILALLWLEDRFRPEPVADDAWE